MKKLLLVDDDDSLRKQFCFFLEKEFEVYEAANRQEALDIIGNTNLDMALVDLGLPPHENSHKEGRVVVQELLKNSRTKVLVLTGQESKEYAQELIGSGVFDYLLKPLDMQPLLSSLRRASFFIENESIKDDLVKLTFTAELHGGLKATSDEAQKRLLLAVLKKTDFNIYQSAKILNISRENCYYFLKKFNITREDA